MTRSRKNNVKNKSAKRAIQPIPQTFTLEQQQYLANLETGINVGLVVKDNSNRDIQHQYNRDTNKFEVKIDGKWKPIDGGSSVENITNNYNTITSNSGNAQDISELKTLVGAKQNINDANLSTTNKTVVGAINELVTSKQNNLTAGDDISIVDNVISVDYHTTDLDTRVGTLETTVGTLNEALEARLNGTI